MSKTIGITINDIIARSGSTNKTPSSNNEMGSNVDTKNDNKPERELMSNEAKDAKNVARQEIDRLNSKAARLEHELSRKY